MTIRISTRSLHEGISDSIAAASQRTLKLQQGLGDGKAVRTVSDDPVRAHQAMWFRERIRAADQYERGIEGVSAYLSNTESTLSQIQDTLGELMSLQTSAADDALGEEGRAALAIKVDQMIELLFELGNTRYAGLYVFGGQRTLDPPLTIERSAEGAPSAVSFNPQGIGRPITRQVGQDLSLTINVTATDVFGEDGELFKQLVQLRDELLANNGDGIRGMAEALDEASERVSIATTSIGSLINRTETLKTRLGEERISYEDGRSRAEDLDVARAIVDFQSEQVSLQAALEAGSRILNLSLLDFIR